MIRFEIPLDTRIEYLTLAVGNAKSHPVSAGDQYESAISFLTDMEEKLEVAQVQLELYNLLFPNSTKSAAAASNNYLPQGISNYNSYNGIIKLDQHFNDKHALSLRYLGTTGTQTARVRPRRVHTLCPRASASLDFGELRAGVAEPADDAPLGVAILGADVVELGGAAVVDVHGLSACAADAGEHALAGVAVLVAQHAPLRIATPRMYIHGSTARTLLDVPKRAMYRAREPRLRAPDVALLLRACARASTGTVPDSVVRTLKAMDDARQKSCATSRSPRHTPERLRCSVGAPVFVFFAFSVITTLFFSRALGPSAALDELR